MIAVFVHNKEAKMMFLKNSSHANLELQAEELLFGSKFNYESKKNPV